MSLIHRVGAGLIVIGGLLPAPVDAQWPLGGCGCNSPAPMAQMPQMAPMFGPEMMAPQMMASQTRGARQYGPRMRAPRAQRPWVYRSRTRTRISGPSMFGDATMGLPLGDCGCSQPAMMMPPVAPMIVPQQSMYPQQIMTYRQVPQTVQQVAAPSPCGQNYAFGGSFDPIAMPTTVTPVPEYNSPATLPTPVPQTSQVQEWQKVRQRPSTIQQQAYEHETQDEGYRVPKAAGRFSSKR